MAEGRALRRAVEKAEEEAAEARRRRRDEDKKRRYKQNRQRVRRMSERPLNSDEEVHPRDLKKGDVVWVNGGLGVIRWTGQLHYETHGNDWWLGVELKQKRGTNNGSVKGKRYFSCKPGHGMFVSEVTKRLTPEDLLDQLAAAKANSKKLKTRLDGFTREKSQKAYLRQQIERLEAQNNNLRKRDVGDIANAVENRMEGFLNVLADSLHPDDYETPGRGSRGAISVPKGHLPPSRASSENII